MFTFLGCVLFAFIVVVYVAACLLCPPIMATTIALAVVNWESISFFWQMTSLDAMACMAAMVGWVVAGVCLVVVDTAMLAKLIPEEMR